MSLGNPLSALPQRISIISKHNIRYEGYLSGYDPQQQVVTLSTVQQWGTEDRETNEFKPPSSDLYEYIIFRGTDIKDIVQPQQPLFGRQFPPATGPSFGPTFNNFGYPPNYGANTFGSAPSAVPNKPLEFPTDASPAGGQADSQKRANTGSSPGSSAQAPTAATATPPPKNDTSLPTAFGFGLDVKSLSQPFETQPKGTSSQGNSNKKPITADPPKKSKADEEAKWRSEKQPQDLKHTPTYFLKTLCVRNLFL